MAITTFPGFQDVVSFSRSYTKWCDGTTERLQRMFDHTEYADEFAAAAHAPVVTGTFRTPWDRTRLQINEIHNALRRAHTKLETLRDLVRDGVVGPVASPRPLPPVLPQIRDVHIHVEGSGSLGQVNVGAAVQNIQSHINAISGPDSDQIARAFKELTEAAVSDDSLDERARTELVEHYEDLSEQAANAPDRRRQGRIAAALERLPVLLETAAKAREAWDQWGPTIVGVFKHQ